MTRLFISHSSKDADLVLSLLKPLLDGQGMIAWCSATDIPSGRDWQRQIRAALAQADWFLVVLSPDAQKSEWVQAETHWAIENMRGRVIPLMFRTCEPAEIHLRLATIQFVDFRADPHAAGQRLLAMVAAGALAPSAAGPALAVAPEVGESGERTKVIVRRLEAEARFEVAPAEGSAFEARLTVRNWAVIGRAEDADLRIPDGCVSRRHAKLTLVRTGSDAALKLTDLDSANGTFVNGEQVLGSQILKPGDLIEVGNARLRLRALIEPSGPGPDTPD